MSYKKEQRVLYFSSEEKREKITKYAEKRASEFGISTSRVLELMLLDYMKEHPDMTLKLTDKEEE